MGFGLPQSIGVCLASGGNRTVCIVGDGGLHHNIQELETLKRLNIKSDRKKRSSQAPFFIKSYPRLDPSHERSLMTRLRFYGAEQSDFM